MTTTQLDHLQRIDAHLAKLIDIAAKRTPGKWKPNKSTCHVKGEEPTYDVSGPQSDWFYLESEHDAAFIAYCAGNAEAGWKATRAAIEPLIQQANFWEGIPDCGNSCAKALESILAAFPLESLTQQALLESL